MNGHAAHPQKHPRIFAPIWVSIGEMEEYWSPECLYDRSAPFEQNIRSALREFHSEPSDSIDLMKYFSWPSDREMDHAVRLKIRAARLSVCAVGETAYTVVDLETTAELTDEEWDVFTRQLEYQYRDGWGAEFEATDIPIGQNKMILARLGCGELIFCHTEEQLRAQQPPGQHTEQIVQRDRGYGLLERKDGLPFQEQDTAVMDFNTRNT